jgi:hypothetical protein
MNAARVEPIHRLQVCILGGIADANDGIGLHILGQSQQLRQGGQHLPIVNYNKFPGLAVHAAGGTHSRPKQAFHLLLFYFLIAKLRMDFLFAMASIIFIPPVTFSAYSAFR